MTAPSYHIPPGLQIRPAAPADIHLLAHLLPRGFRLPDSTRYLVATRDDGELAGGAYLLMSPMPGGGKQAFFNQTFDSEQASLPLNSLLLRACIVQARTAGAQALNFDGMLFEGTPLEQFLTSQGFAPERTLTGYEMELQPSLEICGKVCELLARRNKIPAEARVTAFSEAPLQPAMALLHRYFGISPSLPERTFQADLATVAQCGPRIVGVLIAEERDGKIHVPHTAVDEEFRQGWVTPLLWHRFGCRALEQGYTTVTFATSAEQFRSMSNFAKRMRSLPGTKQSCYRLILPQSPIHAT